MQSQPPALDREWQSRCTAQIFAIERQQMGQTMPLHGRHQARVMSLFSTAVVSPHQRLPRFQNSAFIAQYRKKVFHPLDVSIDHFPRKPSAILFHRPSRDRPILIQHWGHDAQRMPLIVEANEGQFRRRGMRMIPMCNSHENIGVDQNLHSPRPA